MTQEQLAEKVETSHNYIGSVERGEQNVTIKTLEKIANAFQLDLFSLIAFHQEDDETMTAIMALLLQQDEFDRKRVLAIIREVFASRGEVD